MLSLTLGCIPSLPPLVSAETPSCHAIEFDGSSDYIEIEHSSSLNLELDNFTIETWV
jgi:hypothetical protein